MKSLGKASALLLVLTLLVLLTGDSGAAQVKPRSTTARTLQLDPSNAEQNRDQELVSGRMDCSFNTSGFGPSAAWLTFSGTTGIGASTFEVGGGTLATGDGCEVLATSMAAHAVSLGCTTGQSRSHSDAFGMSSSFKFVCQGKRDAVVWTVGQLSRDFLTESP